MSSEILSRINSALDAAARVFAGFDPGRVSHIKKAGGDPVTAADLELDECLKLSLLGPGEGWLSEETADSTDRLNKDLTWIVDPLDGTREFVEGLPEFCASVAAVENGVPTAGGVLNPATGIRIAAAKGTGVFVNDEPITPRPPKLLTEMMVLASRSEVRRGEWQDVVNTGIQITPMGSVAYKMALVAAGMADATWTLVPKHEWDVAGGAALLEAAGGSAVGLDGRPLTFNNPDPLLDGVIAVPPGFEPHIPTVLSFRR